MLHHCCTSPGLIRVSARIMRKRTSSNAQPGGKSAMRRGAAPMVGAANSQVQLREKQSNLCFSLQTGRLTDLPPRSTTRSRGHVWNTPSLDTRPLAPFGIQALNSASPLHQGSACPQPVKGETCRRGFGPNTRTSAPSRQGQERRTDGGSGLAALRSR